MSCAPRVPSPGIAAYIHKEAWVRLMAADATLTLAEVAPAGTRMDGGSTIKLGLLLLSVSSVPPGGAGSESTTVRVVLSS